MTASQCAHTNQKCVGQFHLLQCGPRAAGCVTAPTACWPAACSAAGWSRWGSPPGEPSAARSTSPPRPAGSCCSSAAASCRRRHTAFSVGAFSVSHPPAVAVRLPVVVPGEHADGWGVVRQRGNLPRLQLEALVDTRGEGGKKDVTLCLYLPSIHLKWSQASLLHTVSFSNHRK